MSSLRRFLVEFGAWTLGLLSFSSLVAQAATPELVVYTYDSLAAPKGLASAVVPLFEKQCGCKVKLLASGDAGQMLARLTLDAERGKPVAHVAWGIDQHHWPKARKFAEPWGSWSPKGVAKLTPETRVGAPGEGFLPFDYGVFAFMADQKQLDALKLAAPASHGDLLKPEYKKRFILEDPRTSSPGLGFLLYTLSARSEAWTYWRSLKQQWLTMPQGWDAAYGAFLKGEAPLVWSYISSEAYHRQKDPAGAGRYRAVLFQEGQPLQVEGAFLVRATLGAQPGSRALARRFLEFLLSPEVQQEVPLKNWMHPAIVGTELPESFRKLPKPGKLLKIEEPFGHGAKEPVAQISNSESSISQILDDWLRAIQ
jgi:thiamine transport system substrate-binding protein